MRPANLCLLPPALVALSLGLGLGAAACGGEESIPSSPWHPKTGGGGTGTVAGSSSGSNGASPGGSSGSAAGSSSGGATGSSSGSTSGSSSGSSSSGGSSGGGSSSENLTVTVVGSGMLQMPLMDTETVQVTLAPGGYSGPVQLSATGLPGGVTATFDDATPTLDGSTSKTATVTVTTATDAIITMTSFSVVATVGSATKSADVVLLVEPEITLHIPAGVNDTGATVDNPNSTAYGPYPITIIAPSGGISASSPVTVYFMNDDTVSHEIHADDSGQGFGHDPGPFGAGQMDPYVRKVNSLGTYDFYLHDQGSPITPGRLYIKAAQ